MRIDLPIDAHLPRLLEAMRRGRDIVLVAEPGAGKTTRVPPAIVESGLLEGAKLVMLQPRRVAARAAATRIAEERGWRLGNEVGYQVRFERIMGRDTPLRVLTEGILSRQLVADPSLEGIGCIVLDEFHERSIHSDLSLAMLREAKGALREDLRLVVMSATLDADAVAGFLRETGEVEVLHVPGRMFPVEVEYAGDRHTPVEEQVRAAMEEACPTGDVLVFLPGVREIERTMTAIGRLAGRHGYDVLPLHGSLNKQEQDRAVHFDPHPHSHSAGPPRVICATNIAETSLTLPGVRLVIDSGLVRQAGYDANRGVETLETTRISQASAEQRAGRAGRVAAGRCVRLWSAMTQRRLPPFDIPEIRRVDLCEASLAVRAWGGDPATFGWYEKPEDRLLASATSLLEGIGAVAEGRLTPVGKALQKLPLHPRPARLLTASPKYLSREALLTAALIGEGAEVPGRRCGTIGDLIESYERRRLDPGIARAVDRAREQLARFMDSNPTPNPEQIEGSDRSGASLRSAHGVDVDSLEELLLLAYPDRVCRRRSPETATLVDGGGGARIPDPSALRGEWFVALDVRRGNFAQKQQADVRLLAEIEVEWLEKHFPKQVVNESVAAWDDEREHVVAVRRRRYHDLVIDEQRGGKLDPIIGASVLWEKLEPIVPTLLSEALDGEEAGWLLTRLDFLATWLPAHLKPEVGIPPLFDNAAAVEEACLAAATSGRPTLDGVKLALREIAQTKIWEMRLHTALEEHAPLALTAPSGSRVKLDWSNTLADVNSPDMAVRLQELFGLADTPRICGGRLPVTLHLLGPNFRPVQVTSDLASFWKNVYPQVRKDLRARYPKHSWPEDPLSATPMRGPRRRDERRGSSR